MRCGHEREEDNGGGQIGSTLSPPILSSERRQSGAGAQTDRQAAIDREMYCPGLRVRGRVISSA